MNIQKSVRVGLACSGLNASELASRMGVSAPYVSNVVNGNKVPNLQTIKQIAEITGFKVSEFIALGES